ncbi:MAG: class I SAM-dependent methyltransferase, partial [Pseudomonadota bacterium]
PGARPVPLLSKSIARTRVRKILPHVQGDVLEVGCGAGILYEAIKDQVGSYTGVDIQTDKIAEAQAKFPEATFAVADVDRDEIPYTAVFDTVVMSALIEHIFNLKTLGENLEKALRPGGRVVLTTPTPFGNDVVHRLGARLGLFSPIAVDDHIAIFNKKRCDIFAREFGLKLAAHQTFQIGCNQLAIIEKPAA